MNTDKNRYNDNFTDLSSSDLFEELSDIQLKTVIGGSLIDLNLSPTISVLNSSDGSQLGILSSQASAHQNGSS